jgi:hypothetical protein
LDEISLKRIKKRNKEEEMKRCKQQTSIQRPCPQDKKGIAVQQGERVLYNN